jgi:hypothetical protein
VGNKEWIGNRILCNRIAKDMQGKTRIQLGIEQDEPDMSGQEGKHVKPV